MALPGRILYLVSGISELSFLYLPNICCPYAGRPRGCVSPRNDKIMLHRYTDSDTGAVFADCKVPLDGQGTLIMYSVCLDYFNIRFFLPYCLINLFIIATTI